jgi:photosystem II stability/assembly factor-like uncharacterized protein
MKKLSYVLVLLAGFAVFNNTKAQWVTLNSTTTDTLGSVFFTDANTGYANGSIQGLGYVNHILLKTINGGVTWINLDFSHLGFSVTFTDTVTGYISGVDTIFKTTDAGASWSAYPLGLGTTFALMDIYFFNSSIGYASAWNYNTNANYMLHTTNAGVSWTSVSGGVSASDGSRSIFCTNATTCYAVGWNGGSHGVYKTTDGGNTWNFLSNPSANPDLAGIYFTSAANGVVVGGNGSNKVGQIYQTTNGGSTWNQVYNGSSGSWLTSVYFADANYGIAVGGSGAIVETTDGGTTWSTMASPTTNGLGSVYFPTAGVGYAVGQKGTILKYNRAVIVASEQWASIMDNDSANHGQITYDKYSDGYIAVNGTWYAKGATVQCPISGGTATIVDTVISITGQGTATNLTLAVGSQTSAFTANVQGVAKNGKSSGTYSIAFSATGWPSKVEGTYYSTKIIGSGVTSGTVSVREISANIVPTTLTLFQNYPNPFNPSTTISFSIPSKSFVSLKVFDALGRKVSTLITEELSAGNHTRQWNAQNISSGVYFYRLQAGLFIETKKLILLR